MCDELYIYHILAYICVCNVCVNVCVCLYICILTVGDTLILDLQVLVRSGTGVREHVDPCDHHTLSPVVTPAAQGQSGWMDQLKERWSEREERREEE